jgi:regulator of protease activity HflC (stomatin/prohibitin superfamily)
LEEITGLAWLTAGNIAAVIIGLIVGIAILSSFFTVHTKKAAVIERFGKFSRIATEGLNWKKPFIESVVWVEDLTMQLMDVPVVSKTKDDATVTAAVRIQYYVLPTKVKEAYYELDDPEAQIKAHVENVVLAFIPKKTLDESYQQEADLAEQIKANLAEVMSNFGYSIENALVTSIQPSKEVMAAMNNINTQRRNAIAAKAQADTEKILLIGKAEGEKQSQILAGEGVAGEQKAIVEGLRDSLKEFEEGTHVRVEDAITLIMMARYFDALKEIGGESNTILLPHSPSAVVDIFGQLRNAIISGDVASKAATAAK